MPAATDAASPRASYGSRTQLREGALPASEPVPLESRSKAYVPGTPIGYLAARGTRYEHKFLTKKLGKCCIFLVPVIALIALAIVLVPVLKAIADHALHTSQILVHSANLTNINNDSFPLVLDGQVTKTGVFPAHIYFREPIDVWWNTVPTEEAPMREVHLGQMELAYIGAAAGHARLRQATHFNITDVEAFGEFAAFLITTEEFTWKLNCSNVHVEAFSFLPTYKNLVFNKHVVFKGINDFTDIKILDFQLPGDDPEGGITLATTASLTNPSPFGVEVGTLNLALYYKGLYIGPATTSNLVIRPGVNIISITGHLIPHTDNSTALDLMGELFTGYINGDVVPVQALGVNTAQSDGRIIGWLSTGIAALNIDIPLQSPERINPIKGITINYLSLAYDTTLPYNPFISSQALQGSIVLPFGFTIDIVSIATLINIKTNGATVGTIDGGYSNSSTRLTLLSAGQTAGAIDITLPPTRLSLPNSTDSAKRELEQFQDSFVFNAESGFVVQGGAKAVTDTPIGRVVLDSIAFDVDTGLKGLQGLRQYPTEIYSVDVTGGAPDALQLAVNTGLYNPSNLNLSVGDASFQLQYRDVVGNVTLPALLLPIGEKNASAVSNFDPNRSPAGSELLNRFVSGLDSQVNITGFSGSSNIASLQPSLGKIDLNSTLPGLKKTLVQAADLTVLNTTGVTDNIANSKVMLANPFSSGLNITRLNANATCQGIFIANINTPVDFPAAGNATTASPPIPLTVNLFPPDIFSILRGLVVKSGQDTAQVDGIVALGGYEYTPSTPDPASRKRSLAGDSDDTFIFEEDDEDVQLLMRATNDVSALLERANSDAVSGVGLEERSLEKRDNIYTNFNLPDYVDKAFKTATLDLQINADTTIGEYSTSLAFSQNQVPLGTDETLNLLLPILAQPIVQKIVDGAILNIDTITLSNLEPAAFAGALTGSIRNAGPFDATIEFPQGLTISWNGQTLVNTAFPNVDLVGDEGAALDTNIQASVPDVGYLTEFTKYLLTEKSFIWNIKGEGLIVKALGITVTDINLTKDVQLSGFNGLQGGVTINSFDLPSNDPAGGIHLTAQSTIVSPSQVGVQLTRFGVQILGNGTTLGPSAASNEFTLQPLGSTNLPLAGRLVRQNDPTGLAVLSNVFTRFVHDQNTPLVINGDFAGPANVAWLNDAIKVLSIQNVQLPAQKFDVIRSITINQLSLFFTQPNAYKPPTSSNNTVADFYLPFAFPVDIQHVDGDFILKYQNTDTAVLAIDANAETDVAQRVITLGFNNVPFAVYGNAHGVFSNFLADTTRETTSTFGLGGSTTALANTAAGDVTISDIPFDVQTSLDGLQNLNARPAIVSNLDVARGYPSYLEITVDTALFNPSKITIGTGDVTFNVMFENNVIGTAIISDLVLVPGSQEIPTQIRFQPRGGANVASGKRLLENYIQNVTSAAVVQGTRGTTPIQSLQEALAGITLNTNIPSLGKLIVIEARLIIPKNIAQTGLATVTVMIANPFTASLNLLTVGATATYDGILLATINENLGNNPIRVPGHTTVTSQELQAKIDIDPKNLINFILAAAKDTGTSLGPLPGFFDKVLALQSTKTAVTPYPDSSTPPCNSGKAFDTLGAVLQLLKGLATHLDISTNLNIDEYNTELDFVQSPVPTDTDETALYLVGPVAAPLIQIIVDEASLKVDIANATSLTNNGFDVSLTGSLGTDTPADAYLEFPEPVTVTYKGKNIATLDLPPLCAAAGVGIPNLAITSRLTITNQGAFTSFATDILHSTGFEWTLSTDQLVVRTLGIRFSNVTLNKVVSFDAFNNLPGVTITSFDIPSDNPSERALNIVTDASIPSPATLGIQLDTASFRIYFKKTYIGPVHSTDLFLVAKATTIANLVGQITYKSGNTDIENTGILFTEYLAGANQTLQITGDSVATRANGGNNVQWLTTAFKTLTLDVILPGHIYKIIQSITLSDLTVKLLGDPADSYDVPTSTNNTLATFSNPFGFSLQPLTAAPSLIIDYAGVQTASLIVPEQEVDAGTSAGPDQVRDLTLKFKDAPLHAFDDAHSNFQSFFKAITLETSVTFGLSGNTTVSARTVIGDIPITVPVNVNTTVRGIHNLEGKAPISDLRVESATNKFINIPLSVTLTNPSNVTLFTQDVSLPVVYQNYEVGRAIISQLSLTPGQSVQNTSFHYQPEDPGSTIAQDLLTKYLQPKDGKTGKQTADLTIETLGSNPDPFLTAYQSLEPALEGVKLSTVLDGIGTRIIDRIDVFINLLTLCAGPGGKPEVQVDLTLHNDIPVALTILSIDSIVQKAGFTGSPPYATVQYDFPYDYTIPAAISTNQPREAVTTPQRIPHVLLPRGLIPSLDIVGSPLDVTFTAAARVGGADGYTIPSLKYLELTVPATYQIVAGDTDFGSIKNPGLFLQTLLKDILQLPADLITGVKNCISGKPSSSGRTTGSLLDDLLAAGSNDDVCKFGALFNPLTEALPLGLGSALSSAGCPASTTTTSSRTATSSVTGTDSTATSSATTTDASNNSTPASSKSDSDSGNSSNSSSDDNARVAQTSSPTTTPPRASNTSSSS